MKKNMILSALASVFILPSASFAANLIDVYHEALTSDPTYQQAIANELQLMENVPISRANLLPNLGALVTPFLSRETASGPAATYIGANKQRGYSMGLTLTQTIFNFSQFANLAVNMASAKQASANLNFSAQDLMLRVSRAYFQVLEDEDNLRSSLSTRAAFAKQLDQINQQYKVGLKTITDVYTAEASYEGSDASYIAAENTLANDKENLRAITGKLYPTLAKLNKDFPLITPKPMDIESWVATALHQNWSIIAAQYAVIAAKRNIKQQFGGHLPTLNVQTSYNINFQRNIGGTQRDLEDLPGSLQQHESAVQLNLAIPLVSGGQVMALTKQAQYNYQVVSQQLEQQVRSTANLTRQSYLGIIAGISKIKADIKAIQSAKSSLEGMNAGYRVGTETLVNVLNQQQQVFINEKQYATDRYDYVNNLLSLKEAAGTLSEEDLIAVNGWLLNSTLV